MEKAVVYWGEAGQQALSRFALTEAIAHLRKAVALLRDLPPTEEHKQAAKAAGGGAGAVGDFLKSRTGQQLEREVVRGLFGLLSKSLK